MNRNIILIALLGSIVCQLKLVAQSVTVEAKIDFAADTDGRTGESAIASSHGCQTACYFSCLTDDTLGSRGGNYRIQSKPDTPIPE